MNVLHGKAMELYPAAVANMEAAAANLRAQYAAIQEILASDSISFETAKVALNTFAATVGVALLIPSVDLSDKQVVEGLHDAVMGDARLSITVERT